jgi:hypothetical protein
MKLEMTNFRAVAANLVAEGEVCDVAHPDVSTQTETGTEIAPLIQQIGDTSIAEIDRLMAELQEAKSYLQSEGERIEREMVRYTNLAQMASFTAKIIFDAISQWHPASNQQNASEVTAASTEDDIHRSQWDTSELGQETDATEGDDNPREAITTTRDFSEVGWADFFGNPRLNRDRHADTDRGVSNTKTPYCPCVREEPHPT